MLINLIHPDQKGFLPGRYIGESIRILYDILFQSYGDQTNSQLLLIDFEKAFDSVSHSFLWNVLQLFGFGPNFVKWCQLLYKDANSRILLHGNLSCPFQLGRGCKQGDPLSPFLFILGAEILAIRVRNDNLINGLNL